MAGTTGRVADHIFRRDMVGPGWGNFFASLTATLLLEKLFIEYALPSWVSVIQGLLESYGRTWFLVVAGNVCVTFSFWFCGGLMMIPAFYQMKQWKIQPKKEMQGSELLRAMPLIVFNYLISLVLVPAAFYFGLPDSAFDFKSLPGTAVLARDAFVWLTVEELMFFYLHRFMHRNKTAYALIHKLHHTWTAPVAWVSIYCNPIEHVLCNLTPLVSGPLICGSHIASIGVYIVGGLLHTCAVHSGFWFTDDNGMHDMHHEKFNVNFGVSGFMDVLYGTYQLPTGATRTALQQGSEKEPKNESEGETDKDK
eukprot:TRINITY_DN15381_c0_g1_i1.p1 TRINITY_DN15381_c0_g1~~TRINITY_DN15381_c0_g1_i1.p1  ORF type:complete len:309 (-),score=43.10 TRINITY_DN15381_c0_g1_i1:312-1238(-)